MARKAQAASVPHHMNEKVWKALGSVASTDETRNVLMRVNVREDRRTMEASDGHCALQVTFDEDLDLAPGLYDWRVNAARVKAGVAPEPLKDDQQFPAIDKVMPEAQPGWKERPDVAMNPQLVAKVCDAASTLLGTLTGNTGIGLVWQVGPEDLDAVLAHVKAPGVRIRAAIMPMRIEGPRKRPKVDTFDADSLRADLESSAEDVRRLQRESDDLRAEAVNARADSERHAEALKGENRRAERLVEELASMRAEVTRLSDELTEARLAAETDEADSVRLRATVDDLRAQVNGLRHLRPKVDPEPVLLTRPIVRA